MTVKEIDELFVAGTYNRFPLVLTKGKGAIALDEEGNEYIDMGSGIGVTAFGYCDDEWISAVTEQLSTLQHASNLYYTEPCARLAKILCERTGMKKVFFANSGAEANECAIKVARKYAAESKGEEYSTVITLTGSFHGRTLTTLSATGQEVFHKLFNPLTPGFIHTPPNDIEEMKKAVRENKACAIMLEAVQGEGGVNPLNPDFVKAVKALCDEENILLIMDEVQTGNGRTGELYGYMNFGIQPDIITTAKGLGGGLPIGACLIGVRAQNTLGKGDHGSTYGGNPVACAGAISVINRLTPQLLKGVKAKSEYIFSALNNAEGVESVSGMGLMIGIKTVRPAREVLDECRKGGVLVLTAKDKVRLLPPLNIEMEQLEKAVEVIKTACKIKE